MIRKITLLFLLCLGMQYVVEAQNSVNSSAPQLQATSQYLQTDLKIQKETNDWVSWYNAHNNPNALLFDNGVRRVFRIPVVVHVILPGTLAANPQGSIYDPSDATIANMIDYLNQSFHAAWSAYPDSNSGGTYIPIEFYLAGRDSNCNATNGIERINGSGVANYAANGVDNGSAIGANEVNVKNLGRWPVKQYYNIWIVNKIDGKDGTGAGVFTPGYSYNPTTLGGGAPANKDGMILLATQAAAGKTIVPQQMAKALSVLPTYFGSTAITCPSNANCLTDGDQICDTEPEKNSGGACPAGTTNSCTSVLYAGVEYNFMDNSSCQNRFTMGQKMRMIWGLYTFRSGLIGSTGVLAPGLSPVASCVPTTSNPGNTEDAGVYEVKIADNYNSAYIGNVPYVYMDYISGGYNSDGNNAYVNRTCTQQATLVAGNSYKFFVKTGPISTGEQVAIYIDYNNDGSFSSSELVYSHNGTSANEMDSAVITLPTSSALPSLVTCLPIRMRVVVDSSSSTPDPCLALNIGQAEDYTLIIKGSGITGSVTAVLPPFLDSSCISDTLNFTAVPSAGAGGPITYQWYVNGNQTGIITDTFTTSTIADGSTVDVKMFYTNQCGSVDSTLSNAIVVRRLDTILPVCNIALTVGNNPSCPGYPVTFTATPVHAGTSPGFQWQVNGVNISGATADTFTSATLNSFDMVSCVMTTTSPCAVPAVVTSNLIEIHHYVLTSSVTISVNPNPACSGRNVTFTAAPFNAGANPTFQWYIKPYGSSGYAPVPGATSFIFVTNTLQNNDQVQCTMFAPDLCVINHLDTSNQIIMTIDSTLTPSITDSIWMGQNPWCLDSLITFGGNAINYGGIPNLEWLVNGVPVAYGYTFATDSLHNGDIVTLQVNQTDGGCYTQDTMLTAPITLALVKTPDPPLASLIGTILTSNVNGSSFLWYYNTSNNYLANEVPIVGATNQTYHPLVLGYYYVKVVDSGCASPPSNIIKISLLDVGTYNMDNVKIFPNPTTGDVYLDWGTEQPNIKINVYNSIGQGLLHLELNNQSQKMLDLSNFANGNYFIEIRDESGNIGTTRITLAK